MKSSCCIKTSFLICAFLLFSFSFSAVYAGLYTKSPGLYKQGGGLYSAGSGLYKKGSGLYTPGSGLYQPSPGLYPGNRGLRPGKEDNIYPGDDEEPEPPAAEESGTYSGGDGSAENPYQIETPQDLDEVTNYPNDWDKNFILVNGIDMSEFLYDKPLIGANSVSSFTGLFNGNNNSISRLNIEPTGEFSDAAGLFGYIGETGEVKNLQIEDVNILVKTGEDLIDFVGTLAGVSEGSLKNCSASGNINVSIGQADYIGGLVAYSENLVQQCCTEVTIEHPGESIYLGGLAGRTNQCDIFFCCAVPDINTTSTERAGGLAGDVFQGSVVESFAEGSIQTLTAVDAGGLIGSANQTFISDTFSLTALDVNTISNAMGGHMGENSDTTVENSFSANIMQSTNPEKIGGFAGIDDFAASYQGCFWDTTLNPDVNDVSDANVADVNGVSTTVLKTKSTFTDAGWDFVGETENGTNDIWTIREDVNYPELVWPLVQFVDFDGIDFLDYGIFADHWLLTDCNETADCNSADLDFSGTVDTNDLDIFTNYWLFNKQ